MDYKVIKKGRQFGIVEIGSNYTISWFRTKKQASDVCTQLNQGTGFNGWTPLFFCK
jgi:hypothetical protein